MEYDRQKYGQDPTFSQLFVARSKRLCRYVSKALGICDHNSFRTFEELMLEIEAALPQLEGNNRHFFPSQRIDFQRFIHSNKKQEKNVDALITWTG